MDEDKILLEGAEYTDLLLFMQSNPEYVKTFLTEYGISQEELESGKGWQFGLLEAYKELTPPTPQVPAAPVDTAKAAEAEGQGKTQPLHAFDYAGEVDRAIGKGWLAKEDRAPALQLIETDRAGYDALLTIPKPNKE
jgi:hypothetical protein